MSQPSLSKDGMVAELLSLLAEVEQEKARKKEDVKAYNHSIKGLQERIQLLRQEMQHG